jgi:hypothetical protein
MSKRLLDMLTAGQRKQYPVTTGFLDYFPDAVAMVSHVSYVGNEKHNPGQPVHWARGKSMDQVDCLARHLLTRDGRDGDVLHMAAVAWRAMAELQIMLEKIYGLGLPRGAHEESDD